ncbi:hypothetical protein P280DRAFT_17066 [Massarina eburnea CBS 473.64]|uniref:Uncharacterized protein n=1 Tax=Massarina eburnea CBS 473.64 TaxID=1395130 RepID=A0A6A6SI90_9PLEO|nr:hypothetical protein P280DRAFT_17066 [Massarina eburnea CBS 473.64]
MTDVAVSSQLQEWSFEKPAHPERTASSSSSPNLSHHESGTLRIATQEMDQKDFQDRYLSSEEDLSPTDGNFSDSEYDSDASIHDVQKEVLKVRRMSISRWDKGLSCDMAVSVSYVSAGRPKVIELNNNFGPPAPVQEKTRRSASLAQVPMAGIEKLRKEQPKHRSLLLSSAFTSAPRSISPAVTTASRSLKRAVSANNAPQSFPTTSSVRSASPSGSDYSIPSRPTSSATTSHLRSHPAHPIRTSSYLASPANHTSTFPPPPPLSPAPHAFLNSDPFESSTTNAAAPILKNAGTHRRLRSISMKLSLAKIAITPSTKKWDSRINGKSGSSSATIASPSPVTPFSPRTPMTAPVTSDHSPMSKLRRNSRLLSRPPTRSATTTPDLPTISSYDEPSPAPLKRSVTDRMVARAANERAPALELPPFPEDDISSIRSRPLRKRKSLMDLL